VLGQLGAAHKTPAAVSRADHRRTHTKLDDVQARLREARAVHVTPLHERRRVRFGLPWPAAAFTGRTRELELLDGTLAGAHLVVLAQAVTGAGGVGKTELAARYVQQHAADYDVVAWVRAEDCGVADLSDLAADLGIEVAQLSPVERAGRALAWLAVCEEHWLLVLDNVVSAEELARCCPSAGNGRVIITTRDGAMGQYADAVEGAPTVTHAPREPGRHDGRTSVDGATERRLMDLRESRPRQVVQTAVAPRLGRARRRSAAGGDARAFRSCISDPRCAGRLGRRISASSGNSRRNRPAICSGE
jgi:hypothetical protein